MTSKLPILFFPGLLCDAALWQYQIKALDGAITPHVADLTQDDTVQGMARRVLASAPKQFALAALSMGGYVAFEIMRQAPERVLKLFLCDTSARADTPQQKERRRILLALSQSGAFKGVTPRLLPMLIHASRMDDIPLTEIITAMAERVGREAFQMQQTAIMNRPDSRDGLKNIKCPTQFIVGREDVITSVEIMQEMASTIPSANLTIIENAGHLTPLEQPDKVNRLMRAWLEK